MEAILDEGYDAAGIGLDVSMMIREEICAANYHALVTAYNIHANIVAAYIDNIRIHQQKGRSLPGMVSGDIVTALGMT